MLDREDKAEPSEIECVNEDEIDFQIIKKVLHAHTLVEIQLEEEEEEEEPVAEVDWDGVIAWSQGHRAGED